MSRDSSKTRKGSLGIWNKVKVFMAFAFWVLPVPTLGHMELRARLTGIGQQAGTVFRPVAYLLRIKVCSSLWQERIQRNPVSAVACNTLLVSTICGPCWAACFSSYFVRFSVVLPWRQRCSRCQGPSRPQSSCVAHAPPSARRRRRRQRRRRAMRKWSCCIDCSCNSSCSSWSSGVCWG